MPDESQKFSENILFYIIVFTMIIGAVCMIFVNVANAYPADVSVCFTPGDRCDKEIISEIGTAKKSILVQAYQLTSKPISNALLEAKESGVNISVILDKSQNKSNGYSPAQFFCYNKVPVWMDIKPRIAHNKIIIIDEKEVITGSYNFSHAAQYNNSENVVFIKSKEISRQYTENFNSRLSQSFKYLPLEKFQD